MSEKKEKILIVDDSEINRSILADMLGEEFEILEAVNGVEAVGILRSQGVELSLVLLDIVMPKMDGLEVLAMMNSYKWIEDIPVIMISSESGSSYIGRAYELGATDYIQRPFDAAVVHRRVTNAIMLHAKQKKLMGIVEEQIYEKGKEQSLMINVLSYIVELRNGESGLHVLHIYTMTEILLQSLLKMTDAYQLSPQDISMIATASALHDIGKICIDEKILNKKEPLSPEELETVKRHTKVGAEMLDNIPFNAHEPLLRVASEICRWHHERYDGSGYPDGLIGEEIPVSAQVVALADVYDELTSGRFDGKAVDHDKAIEMIAAGKCGAFNPVLIKVLQWVSAKIRNELRVNSLGGTNQKDIARITREIISHNELTVSQRTLDLLEREREKYRFIASVTKEIIFDLYREPSSIAFSDEGADMLGVDTIVSDPLHDPKLLSCFGKKHLNALFELIDEATQEQPTIEYVCDAKLNGVSHRCRISLMTMYPKNASNEELRYDSAIGTIEIIEK
ncbi:MAG: response regulator [Corallococcus sp.]|nr:response regulator [Corallococcus sp.]